MSEVRFDPSEMRDFVLTKVSAVHRSLTLQALEANSVADVQEIGLRMAGEKAVTGFVFQTGGIRIGERPSLWANIVEEVHDFFCTRSVKYRKERNQGAGLFEHAVTVISTALASRIGLGTGIVTGLVTIAVISISKISKNAWCQWAKGVLHPRPGTS